MKKDLILDKILIKKNFILPKNKIITNAIKSKNPLIYEEINLQNLIYDFPYLRYNGENFDTRYVEQTLHHYVLEGEVNRLYILRNDFNSLL